ncbi:SHOCT domain-containing protein [Aneurinibacillus terranovensis]|uniref:SHOCT domain-containing protein n=1 Tax=Aneurinibacillus terranovensis TaxID=278991 RepID=UPI00040A2ACE|nr:SHOCT domain-containing protein [Aneurinibacillus terranovensis]
MLNCLQNFGMGGLGMFAWMLLQWGLLLGVIYLSIRWIRGNHSKSSEDTAVKIVRERYANGEMTEQEYNRLLEKLK